jgi:hypothetical protein
MIGVMWNILGSALYICIDSLEQSLCSVSVSIHAHVYNTTERAVCSKSYFYCLIPRRYI